MNRSMRALTAFVLAFAFALPNPLAANAASGTAVARAQRLYEDALRRLERGTTNQKRLALEGLEQAALLDPDRPQYALTAGRVCLTADMLHQARHWAERVLERD